MKKLFSLLILLPGLVVSMPLWAYNFLYIHPTTGKPIGWEPGTNIQYWLDPGSLGRLTNEQARTLLKEAMKIWENASPDANPPKFEFAGYLPEDVNGTNYGEYVTRSRCYDSDLESCPTESQRNLQTVIVFDEDNKILDGLCEVVDCRAYAEGSVFGGSSADISNTEQGYVVIGQFYGISTVKVDLIVGVMVHELGHLLGLAHTSVNQEGDLLDEESRYNFIPSMFWQDRGFTTLTPDDIAGISVLYPSEIFATNTATIKGKILKSDGLPNYYTNVIARNVDDPLCEAYSFLAGRICQFASSSVFCGEPADNNSEYIIWGLPPSTYTLEVEEVANDSLAMTLAPGLVDPFIYGDAEFWNEGDTAGDPSHLTSSVITLAAGETRENVDIVLNRSEVTDDRIKYIPLDTFTPGPGTRCPSEPLVNYAEMIGIDEGASDGSAGNGDTADTGDTSGTTNGSTSSGSSGGCSLVRGD